MSLRLLGGQAVVKPMWCVPLSGHSLCPWSRMAQPPNLYSGTTA